MIRHIVMLDLPDGHDSDELSAIMTGLDTLRTKVPGFIHFEHGPNRDFEGLSKNRSYGFVCTFDNETASKAYLVDPDHQALGKRLVTLCSGGVEGLTVIDLEVAS